MRPIAIHVHIILEEILQKEKKFSFGKRKY